MNICSVDGCDRRVKCKGKCNTHYAYEHRTGRPAHMRDEMGRLLEKVRKDPGGCWIFTGPLTQSTASAPRGEGYGRFRYQGRYIGAHRASYMLHVGPIPDGMQIDHLCKNRACVNPEHLEPVTPLENLLRSNAASTINARKTSCMRGHPFSEENTYTSPQGKRQCKECRKGIQDRYRRSGKKKRRRSQQGTPRAQGALL